MTEVLGTVVDVENADALRPSCCFGDLWLVNDYDRDDLYTVSFIHAADCTGQVSRCRNSRSGSTRS